MRTSGTLRLVYVSFTRAGVDANGPFMAARETEPASIWESPMLDVVFIALTCALFLLAAGYAVLCDRL
jgi:hypothetical protein